jgi:C-terminal peptidase prc
MSQGQLHAVVRHLRRIVGDAAPETTDRQLLERFSAARDESAFAALVERHGPLVWGVCRRALRHHQDAEDVFQATFLVLARQAGAVRWRDSVHNWLYEVASRLAAAARVKAARRRLHEGRAAAKAPTEALPDDAARELGAVLDQELGRLPPRLRAPLLLCYLEGRTSDQAARQLGWSLRTLQRRLAQGRELLRARLTRRGLTLSAALLAPALAQASAVPAPLVTTTLKTAVAFTAGSGAVPARAAALAQGMLRGMVMTRVKFAAVVLLVLGTITGAGVLAYHPFGGSAAAGPGAPAGQAPAAGKDEGAAKETPRKPAPLGHRLWAIMDLVREKHPEPPARDAMMLGAAEALFKATNASPPDDLARRVAGLKTREQLDTFLQDAWPRGADEARNEQVGAAVLEGLFATIPGKANLIPADVAKVVEAASANRYVGIGIILRIHSDEKVAQIVSPVAGGPAHKAGILPDDLILEVDGKSTRDVPIAKVVEWIRGDEGTSFTLLVQTPGAEKARTLKMTRSVVPFETVLGYHRTPGDGWEFLIEPKGPVAYLRMQDLKSSTPHELRQLERRLKSEGARALVLDFRNGGGSDLHNGTLVASALLDGGLMWTVRGADKQVQVCRAGHECLFRDWPMALLINDNVDSAEGAVVAALQDGGRAALVGEPTRNGGFVTSMLPLPDGMGSLTFRTGSLERAAKERGWPVKPDHEVTLTKEQRKEVDEWLTAKQRLEKPGSPADQPPKDPQLDEAVELLRAALKKKDQAR